jgi:hypothetical protein
VGAPEGSLTRTASTEEGPVLVDLWARPRGREEFAQVPEVQRAQRDSGPPAPSSFERYDQVQLDEYAVGGVSGD